MRVREAIFFASHLQIAHVEIESSIVIEGVSQHCSLAAANIRLGLEKREREREAGREKESEKGELVM